MVPLRKGVSSRLMSNGLGPLLFGVLPLPLHFGEYGGGDSSDFVAGSGSGLGGGVVLGNDNVCGAENLCFVDTRKPIIC